MEQESLWARVVARIRETSWALDANDGTIAVAGILQGLQLSVHDALGAQLDADHGLEEITPATAPLLSGTQTALAFAIGALVPLLITYFVPLAIEDTLILVAVVVSLILTSLVAAGVGRLSALRMMMRSMVVGLGTMAVSYAVGLFFF